jgi:hypothetical protein
LPTPPLAANEQESLEVLQQEKLESQKYLQVAKLATLQCFAGEIPAKRRPSKVFKFFFECYAQVEAERQNVCT